MVAEALAVAPLPDKTFNKGFFFVVVFAAACRTFFLLEETATAKDLRSEDLPDVFCFDFDAAFPLGLAATVFGLAAFCTGAFSALERLTINFEFVDFVADNLRLFLLRWRKK